MLRNVLKLVQKKNETRKFEHYIIKVIQIQKEKETIPLPLSIVFREDVRHFKDTEAVPLVFLLRSACVVSSAYCTSIKLRVRR